MLTTGALGGNHALATTIYARECGLRTRLMLIPQPVTPQVRRTLLLDHAYGSTVHFAPTVAAARRAVIGLLVRGALGRDRPPPNRLPIAHLRRNVVLDPSTTRINPGSCRSSARVWFSGPRRDPSQVTGATHYSENMQWRERLVVDDQIAGFGDYAQRSVS